jgi:hypothetical protein
MNNEAPSNLQEYNMNAVKPTLFISIILAATLTTSVAWTKEKLPKTNAEGMELVEDTRSTTIYADPGADLGIYDRIMLVDASVAFKKNWQRDQNRSGIRSASSRVKDDDVERIKQDVAVLFREVFTEELEKGGYQLVNEAGENVLTARPAIIDLDVIAPDIRTTGRSSTYSETAGEMTLLLELYDSVTNDKIVTARDRKRDYQRGYLEWRTSVSNRATAKRMMRSWAIAFRESLDDAKSSVKSANK